MGITMIFKKAITRKPGREIVNGLTSADLGRPDPDLALAQHQAYRNALSECGLEVEVLEPDHRYPDGTFVEDTAIVTFKGAIITRPGAPSRRGEEELTAEVLGRYFPYVERIKAPGTLDGGDVLQVENDFFIGLSARTNQSGVDQLSSYLRDMGFTASIVPLTKLLHLKTAVSSLGSGVLVLAGELLEQEVFDGFRKIVPPAGEEYAANCIRMNDYVLLPAGFPGTKRLIEDGGFKVKTVDMSEFRKVDGGLSCLSLRF